MRRRIFKIFTILTISFSIALTAYADRRDDIYKLGLELEKQATHLAQSSYDHFKGWSGVISDQEQAILFKSEAFAASCRLFLRLTEESSSYYRDRYLGTNLYNAFIYLARSFSDLEGEMKRGDIMPYALSNCRRILDRMDYHFSKWPSPDNLAYLHQKYVKAKDAAVYLIERKDTGVYIRRAFSSLESVFRYNYELKRGKNPWKYLVEVSEETLKKMEKGPIIDMTFEGWMIMEMSNKPNRAVYLIQNGKKCPLGNPSVVQRYGGWGNVYEVPIEIIERYPEGELIK